MWRNDNRARILARQSAKMEDGILIPEKKAALTGGEIVNAASERVDRPAGRMFAIEQIKSANNTLDFIEIANKYFGLARCEGRQDGDIVSRGRRYGQISACRWLADKKRSWLEMCGLKALITLKVV